MLFRSQLRRGRGRRVRFPCCSCSSSTCHSCLASDLTHPGLSLFRTLAQRAAKRAKAQVVVIKDEPTATTGGAPETTLPDPAITSQSSPQRKHMVYFLLLGARGCSFPLLASDHWFVCAGAEQLLQEGVVITSDSSSASTTPPRADSPARERSPARKRSPSREESPARGESLARDSANDPLVVEVMTADPSTGSPSCPKLSL